MYYDRNETKEKIKQIRFTNEQIKEVEKGIEIYNQGKLYWDRLDFSKYVRKACTEYYKHLQQNVVQTKGSKKRTTK